MASPLARGAAPWLRLVLACVYMRCQVRLALYNPLVCNDNLRREEVSSQYKSYVFVMLPGTQHRMYQDVVTTYQESGHRS